MAGIDYRLLNHDRPLSKDTLSGWYIRAMVNGSFIEGCYRYTLAEVKHNSADPYDNFNDWRVCR